MIRYDTKYAFAVLLFALNTACNSSHPAKQAVANEPGDSLKTKAGQEVNLPAPFATKSVVNGSDAIGWKDGKTPIAPPGFTVTKFADKLENPRWIYIGPNGDIFICESNGMNTNIKAVGSALKNAVQAADPEKLGSANRITLFRDTNHDGVPDARYTFLTGLNHPLGMAIIGDNFYVANNDAVVAYPYHAGQTRITDQPRKITDINTGKGHWTRNILASRDGKKLYLAVGSGSNIGENGMDKEEGRACIWIMNPDGSDKRLFATGIRNPVGMAWAPGTNTLWTSVNERDELGDDLVPDYMTSVKDGGFYGWPYSYWGQHEDPRLKDRQRPDLVKRAIVPEVPLGAHTASLGLAFDERGVMPGHYKSGAFIGQHGSWNRSVLTGYAVVYVPFANGRPSGKMEPFLTGFIADTAKKKVYGRPVGVAITQGGDMLVADDDGNVVWRVSRTR